jgi:hypothetical protein
VESRQERPANGRADAPAAASRIGERVGHSADETWDRAREGIGELREKLDLQGRANRHPYGTVAAALGIGYVIGGGLFTPLTGRLVGLAVRLGLRLAVLPVIKDELQGLAESLTQHDEEGEVGGGHGSQP